MTDSPLDSLIRRDDLVEASKLLEQLKEQVRQAYAEKKDVADRAEDEDGYS